VSGIAATDLMPDHAADDAPENNGRGRAGAAFRIISIITVSARTVFVIFTAFVVVAAAVVLVLMLVLVPSAVEAVIMTRIAFLHLIHPDFAVTTVAITVTVTIAAIGQHQRRGKRGNHSQDSGTQ
jgi:hypothetical protein